MIPEVSKLDRSNIDKIAQNQEDRILLAKLWDKINGGIRRNIPANTGFLSPREQERPAFCLVMHRGFAISVVIQTQNERCSATFPTIWMRRLSF